MFVEVVLKIEVGLFCPSYGVYWLFSVIGIIRRAFNVSVVAEKLHSIAQYMIFSVVLFCC